MKINEENKILYIELCLAGKFWYIYLLQRGRNFQILYSYPLWQTLGLANLILTFTFLGSSALLWMGALVSDVEARSEVGRQRAGMFHNTVDHEFFMDVQG